MTAFDASDEDGAAYITLADLAINLALILAFFVAAVNAVGRAGWEQVRYRDAQRAFHAAVVTSTRDLPSDLRPDDHLGKNDPPGVQRWVFRGAALFDPGSTQLRPEAIALLLRFSKVLRATDSAGPTGQRVPWRRIRIEGHSVTSLSTELDEWGMSAARASAVARVLYSRGHIPPHRMAVAGRANQDLLDPSVPLSPVNERVEILVEFAQRVGESAPSPR